MSARVGLFAIVLLLCGPGFLGSASHAHAQDSKDEGEPHTAPAANEATSAAPKVTSKLTPGTVSVGETAKLVITVDAPSSSEVSLPEQSFGKLELSDRHVRTQALGDRTLTTYELDLLALEDGKLELPALSLRFVSVSGELTSASTEPLALTVRSLIANEPNAEPKPATRPISVMRDDYTLAWVGLGLLAVALIALATLLISRWLKRRPKPAEPLPPPRPAWELAIERLHTLLGKKEELFAADRGEEFVDGVSDALREYLGKRYGFDGLERTTGELMTTLGRLRPHKLSLEGVQQLLDQCDLVKFARAKPDANECQDLWNGAIGLIRATTPLHQPQAPLATPSSPPPALNAAAAATGWSGPPPARASRPSARPAPSPLESFAPPGLLEQSTPREPTRAAEQPEPTDLPGAVPSAEPQQPTNAPEPEPEPIDQPEPELGAPSHRSEPRSENGTTPTPSDPFPILDATDSDDDLIPDAPTVVMRSPLSLPPEAPEPELDDIPTPRPEPRVTRSPLPPPPRVSLPPPARRGSIPPPPPPSSRPAAKRIPKPASSASDSRPPAAKRSSRPPAPRKPPGDREKS